jgi:hypothetical protein
MSEQQTPEQPRRPRMVRTPEEAFWAGWEDGKNDRPLSPEEIRKIAALWRPYFRRGAETA